MSKCKIAIVQMSVHERKSTNLKNLEKILNEISKDIVDMVILPEMFCCPYETHKFPLYAEYENGDTFT